MLPLHFVMVYTLAIDMTVKEEQGNAVCAVHFTVRAVSPAVLYQQDKVLQFYKRMGVATMWDTKFIKVDWPTYNVTMRILAQRNLILYF